MNITIKKDSVFEEEIKKSRFICQLKRIENENQARDFIAKVKKENHKANHNCSAFIISEHQEIQRSSDDGEPSGTAGVPMLETLKKREIVNVVAVVTRYFGGIKLGAGGLIRAYSGCVANALDASQLVKIVEQKEIKANMDYSLFDTFSRYLKTQNLTVKNAEFTTEVICSIFIDETNVSTFISEITDKFNDRIGIVIGEKQFVEVDL